MLEEEEEEVEVEEERGWVYKGDINRSEYATKKNTTERRK